jgi:hypothetical protein
MSSRLILSTKSAQPLSSPTQLSPPHRVVLPMKLNHDELGASHHSAQAPPHCNAPTMGFFVLVCLRLRPVRRINTSRPGPLLVAISPECRRSRQPRSLSPSLFPNPSSPGQCLSHVLSEPSFCQGNLCPAPVTRHPAPVIRHPAPGRPTQFT